MSTATAYTLPRSADDVVRLFDGLKPKPGGGYTALCPGHPDKARSLSIDVRDGKILLRCFAGCDVTLIAAQKGITLADLFLEDRGAPAAPVVPTVESLAAAKGLPAALLRRYGARNVAELTPAERLHHGVKASDGVWIPYFNPDGTIAGRTRLRSAHVAKDGSRWCGSFGAPLPYGLQDLADAGTQGMLVVCEGESDYWSLRAMEIPAIGMPGASTVGALKREYLPEGVQAVYVAQDSDGAGATFAAAVASAVGAWGLSCVPVRFPAGCKDVNDFYRRDPGTASTRFLALLAEAVSAGARATREFSSTGELYTFTLPEYGIKIEVDQLRRAWGELVGELAVIRDGGMEISRGTINLSSFDKREVVAQRLTRRSGLAEIDWPALLDEFARRCLSAEKTGGIEHVRLGDVILPAATPKLDVDGIILDPLEPCCLFGDGNTGKSLLSLYILGRLAQRGMRVGYVDGETNKYVQKRRVQALFGADPGIEYLYATKPLPLAVDALTRKIRELGLTYLVLDSISFLCPEPEKSESVERFSAVLRRLGVGTLSLAHVTKAGDAQQQKPFGSVMWHNRFRVTWNIQRTDHNETTTAVKAIGLWCRKYNDNEDDRDPAPLGFQLIKGDDSRVRYQRVDLAGVEGLAGKLPVWRQIEGALRGCPMARADIHEQIEAPSLNAIDKALAKGRKLGKFHQLPTGQWCLTSEHSSE